MDDDELSTIVNVVLEELAIVDVPEAEVPSCFCNSEEIISFRASAKFLSIKGLDDDEDDEDDDDDDVDEDDVDEFVVVVVVVEADVWVFKLLEGSTCFELPEELLSLIVIIINWIKVNNIIKIKEKI